jgi:hypothetical protein
MSRPPRCEASPARVGVTPRPPAHLIIIIIIIACMGRARRPVFPTPTP